MILISQENEGKEIASGGDGMVERDGGEGDSEPEVGVGEVTQLFIVED